MNNDISLTSVVRQRGQLTIPNKVRKGISWLSDGAVVNLVVTMDKEVKILPYSKITKSIDWGKIWGGIKIARNLTGARGNLSEFISKDRLSH